MFNLANQYSSYVICDFVAPLPEMRNNFKADWTIWLNTIKKSRFEDTNNLFIEPNDYDFKIDKNKLLEKISRINLFLKHKTMTLSFCHNIQSKIINDLNIVTEKKLYPVNNKLFTEKISNDLSMQMFNKLNKNQIDFLYENSSIDSDIYFNLRYNGLYE